MTFDPRFEELWMMVEFRHFSEPVSPSLAPLDSGETFHSLLGFCARVRIWRWVFDFGVHPNGLGVLPKYRHLSNEDSARSAFVFVFEIFFSFVVC